jgi:hypothetical protein
MGASAGSRGRYAPKFRGALRLAVTERDVAVLLMVAFWVYAWCPNDDLQVVAEERDVIVQTSHHGEAIVRSADPQRIEGIVALMVASGLPRRDERTP